MSKRASKRESQSVTVTSIGTALAAIDILFDESDEEEDIEDISEQVTALREHEEHETPIPQQMVRETETPVPNDPDTRTAAPIHQVPSVEEDHQEEATPDSVAKMPYAEFLQKEEEKEEEEEEQEQKEEEEHLQSFDALKSTRRSRRRTVSDVNTKSFEKEIISDILKQLKVAITFLFHAESPLHKGQSHASDNWSYALFEEYNENIREMDPDIEIYTAKINLLYSKTYQSQHKDMYKTWQKWQEYARNDKDKKEDLKAWHASIQHHEEYLEEIADDFILSKSIFTKTSHSLIASFAAPHHIEATIRPDQLLTMATQRKQTRQMQTESTRNQFAEFAMDLSRSADVLQTIEDRASMKQWIEKYKLNGDDLMSKACVNCCCCQRDYSEDAGQAQLDITSPMTTWSWQNVVALIEASEEVAHLASVFWQYKINGLELCKMGSKQLELLVECSMLSDEQFVESELDRLKRESGSEWTLSREAERFVYYKDKIRIEAHVIARYHLAMDILRDVIYGVLENDDTEYKEFYQDFGLICDLLEILRAEHIDGSKQYWKMDAYFFDKIDNYLAILISNPLVLTMYHESHSDFLVPSDKVREDYVYSLMEENDEKKRNQSLRLHPSTRTAASTMANRNARDSIKYITSKLNLMHASSHQEQSVRRRRRKCIETFVNRFCCAFVGSSINTIYIPLLGLTLVLLLSTSLFIIIWFYSHGFPAQIEAMHISINAVGERIHNSMVDEFWMPQMLMSMAIGSLYNGGLHINAATSNGAYDSYFIAFSGMERAESIFGLGLYNADDNTLLMGYRGSDDAMMISNFNGTCRRDILKVYLATDVADSNRIDCDYDPTTQDWYPFAMNNINKAVWTEPHSNADGHIGMSLVAAFEFNHTLIVFLCEMRVDTLKDFALLKRRLPPGSVIMIATPQLHIIASSTDEVYLKDDDPTDGMDPLIASTVEYISNSDMNYMIQEEVTLDHDKGYTMSIFPFHMVYVNCIPAQDEDEVELIRPLLLNNTDDYQFGYILISNDDTYLYNVDLALILSLVALVAVLITTIALICVNMKYYDSNMGKAILNANSERLHWLSHANKRISNENPKLKQKLSASLKRNGLTTVELSKPREREESAYSAVSCTMTETKPKSFAMLRKKHIQIGDHVSTKDGAKGTVTQITKLLEDASFSLIGLKLENGRTVFTNKSNIIVTLPPITDHVETRPSQERRWEKTMSHSPVDRETKDEEESETEREAKAPPVQEKEKRECLQLTQQQLIIASFIQNFVLVLFLILIWAYLLSSGKSELTQNVLATHEWGSVKDGVMRISEKAETVLALYRDRLERGAETLHMDNDLERGRFLSNIMQSFVTSHVASDPLYSLYYSYLGTPDGAFFGVGWAVNETRHDLMSGVRNEGTDWILNINQLSEDASTPNEPLGSEPVYDPRCRVWYQNAMQYTFNGSIDQAFPSNRLLNSSFNEFVTDTHTVASSPNCKTSRRLYGDMFNITLSPDTKEIVWSGDNASYAYDASNDTEQGVPYTLVWSRYIFFSLAQIGLTASAAIQDPVTGDLFGVVGIDFTLGQLSRLLYDTVQQGDSASSNDWYAWIYDATDVQRPQMIASSEFQILTEVDSHVEGCVSIAEVDSDQAKVPYYATSHPVDRIAVASTEINVTGFDTLNEHRNASISIGVPINFPMVEAGRVSFFPGGVAGIDWIVAKTINDSTYHSVDSIQVTFFVSFTILAMALFLMKEFDFVDLRKEEEDEFSELEDKKDANYYYRLMLKMKGIVLGSANVAWKLMVESKNDGMYIKNAISTRQAKEFMANRANQHIAAENENELKFIECAWEAALQSEFTRSQNKKTRIKFFRFIESNLYGVLNQFFLGLHLATSLFEPATPKQLQEEGLSSWVLLTLGICIVMEWLDVILIIYRRYIEFSIAEPFLTQLYEINYGMKHKYTKWVKYSERRWKDNKFAKRAYLVWIGPRCKIFLIHCILNGLILFNFITRITFRTGYLSYYFPVLPFLLLIRNETVLKFSTDFIFAVLYCKDVLFSYMCFILIFAVLSMSLFRSVVNADRFNESFESITQALITAFVYISTSENYTFMYDVFDASYYRKHGELMLINATFVSLLFAMIGLFIFVPMIIHRFELAFAERRILEDLKNIASKENAIVSAFIMLDMNGDLDIDNNEFQSLVQSSILLEKNQFDINLDAGININGFVQHLLKQTFRTKIMSSKVRQQNKLRAWLECNVIRHRLYKVWVLIICVMTFLMASLLKGLEIHTIEQSTINYSLYVLFAINMIEIHFVVFVYGISRYWDLIKYPNPNYVAAAINKYDTKAKSFNFGVRLTSSQRTWVNSHLADVRPLSILEKSTATLIHRLQLTLIWATFLMFIAAKIYFYVYYTDDQPAWIEMNEQYSMYFIQFGVLIRVFFLIPVNQKLIWVIFSVFPQFLSLFAFLGLFMYGYARIGCTLFGDGITDVVTDIVYPQSASIKAKFNNLPFAMLALLQLMVGEGWHELMYFNVIATHPGAAVYFIAYITAVTIIISNVFVGLFLSEIDQLSTQQGNDDILVNSHKTESFEKYANYKLNLLNYQVKMDRIQSEKMQKQIDQIELLLYHHKLNKVKQQEWMMDS